MRQWLHATLFMASIVFPLHIALALVCFGDTNWRVAGVFIVLLSSPLLRYIEKNHPPIPSFSEKSLPNKYAIPLIATIPTALIWPILARFR